MSSISSSSSYSPAITTIDYAGNNQYRVVDKRDQDGDGVVDGKALSGDEGKIVNEGALNQMLAARGLKAVNGSFQSVDGFQLTSTNTTAVTSFGADPVLPNVSGPSDSPQTLQNQMNWLEVSKGLDDAALMWMALSTLATTAMRDIKDANDIKRALQSAKMEAKTNEISATESRIAAEKEAATQSFICACVGAAASMGFGAFGGSSGGMTALSQSINGLITKFGEMTSKSSGKQAEADYQQVREKVYQQQQEIMELAIEDAKSNYDESKELFKNALKAITDHVDREVQVTQTITRS